MDTDWQKQMHVPAPNVPHQSPNARELSPGLNRLVRTYGSAHVIEMIPLYEVHGDPHVDLETYLTRRWKVLLIRYEYLE